jgi:hypothetical protein
MSKTEARQAASDKDLGSDSQAFIENDQSSEHRTQAQ